jgi:hypothetical protein
MALTFNGVSWSSLLKKKRLDNYTSGQFLVISEVVVVAPGPRD